MPQVPLRSRGLPSTFPSLRAKNHRVSVAELVAAAYGDRLRSFGERAPGRFVQEVAGLLVVSLGVDEPWGLQVAALVPDPDPAAVDEAVAWCRDGRGREPQVVVRARCSHLFPTFAVADKLGALVAPAKGAQSLLEIELAQDVVEFRSVYASSFGMPQQLVDALVVEADLNAVPHMLGRVGGQAVACAQLRIGDSAGYVSGVGVVPELQGRGYGSAMLAACREEAGRRGCELVWLNAAPHNVPFYEGIGFELVDTHVALTPG